jgi:hypothetical protein
MKFSLQSYNTTTTIETTNDDLDIDEVFDILESLVLSAGYQKSSWDRAIKDLAGEDCDKCGENCECKKVY